MSVRREEAVVVEEEHRIIIHLGNLGIEINQDPQTDGPLGVESLDGHEPGVIFWKNKAVMKNWEEGFFEHSGGPKLGHAKLSEMTVESILDEVGSQ